MKKEYRRILRKLFTSKIKESVVGIDLWLEKSKYIFQGETVYFIHGYKNVSVFIILIPSSKYDSFTVELSWSKKEKFPELSVRPNAMFVDPEFADEYSVRLPYITNTDNQSWEITKKEVTDPLEAIIEDMKKPTEEEAVAKLTPLVNDSVQKLIDSGIPYLERFLGSRLS